MIKNDIQCRDASDRICGQTSVWNVLLAGGNKISTGNAIQLNFLVENNICPACFFFGWGKIVAIVTFLIHFFLLSRDRFDNLIPVWCEKDGTILAQVGLCLCCITTEYRIRSLHGYGEKNGTNCF